MEIRGHIPVDAALLPLAALPSARRHATCASFSSLWLEPPLSSLWLEPPPPFSSLWLEPPPRARWLARGLLASASARDSTCRSGAVVLGGDRCCAALHVRFCRYRFPATDLNSKATWFWIQ
jgi:hypothetical protein